ncbi:hypothetical protein MNBD_GAMMA15-136 [hydrothermal vent metagenome]|uniref:Pilus assembly protein n=1 Tax=hydrothermal vent metagenome TaxID=652676 RepID=A0A3B0YXR7_9ZZZZ
MKARLAAAGLHFLASAFVISLSLYVIYFIWYPNPFYTMHSVFDAVKIVLAVDLVLGPFLTLVIFNTSKPRKELIRDISIILIIQVSALTWGMHVTYKMRPTFFVFQADTFYPIIREDIDLENLNKEVSPPAIWQSPVTIYIEPLKGMDAIQRLKEAAKGGGLTGEMYKTEKYKPLSLKTDNEYRQDIISQAMSYDFLQKSKTWKSGVEELVLSQGGVIEDYLFYPVENDRFRGLIAFKKTDFSIAGLVAP